jgi:hypothetical protein
VLLEVEGVGFAVAHLTWTRRQERNPTWPTTELSASLDDWMQSIRDDHEDFFTGA